MRFGRKKEPAADAAAETSSDEAVQEPAEVAEEEYARDGARVAGPHDIADVEVDEADPTKVNLGSLIISGRPGIELRLQVDEASEAVAAALLVTQEGAVELRAFASPRGGAIWDDVRRSIRADVARQGGTATETDGPWGTELQLVVTGKDDSGATVTQATRIAGITGPRWMLRATFFGKAAAQPDPDDPLEQAVRDVIVVRGSQAMAPGEFLPLTLPAGAQRLG